MPSGRRSGLKRRAIAWRQPPAASASAAIRVVLVLHLFLQVAVGFLRLADALLGLALDVVAKVTLDIALDVGGFAMDLFALAFDLVLVHRRLLRELSAPTGVLPLPGKLRAPRPQIIRSRLLSFPSSASPPDSRPGPRQRSWPPAGSPRSRCSRSSRGLPCCRA